MTYEPKNNRLRTLREMNGLTQEQMANELDLSLSAYRNFENGYRDMKLQFAMFVCTKYGCSIDWLVCLREDESDWKVH